MQRVAVYTDSDRTVQQVIGGEYLRPFFRTAPLSPVPQTLRAGGVPGVTRTKQPDGSFLISVDEQAKRNAAFFVEAIPCWFEGCEELRKSYNADVVKETAEWMQQHPGKPCPGCVAAAVNARYMVLLGDLDTTEA